MHRFDCVDRRDFKAHLTSACIPLLVEAAPALHQANRLGRIAPAQLEGGLAGLDEYWSGFNVVKLTGPLMHAGAAAAGHHGLRGCDSLHCAAGLLIAQDPSAVLVSGDTRLLAVWHFTGAATAAIS